jgi:hypothetical protein
MMSSRIYDNLFGDKATTLTILIAKVGIILTAKQATDMANNKAMATEQHLLLQNRINLKINS